MSSTVYGRNMRKNEFDDCDGNNSTHRRDEDVFIQFVIVVVAGATCIVSIGTIRQFDECGRAMVERVSSLFHKRKPIVIVFSYFIHLFSLFICDVRWCRCATTISSVVYACGKRLYCDKTQTHTHTRVQWCAHVLSCRRRRRLLFSFREAIRHHIRVQYPISRQQTLGRRTRHNFYLLFAFNLINSNGRDRNNWNLICFCIALRFPIRRKWLPSESQADHVRVVHAFASRFAQSMSHETKLILITLEQSSSERYYSCWRVVVDELRFSREW